MTYARYLELCRSESREPNLREYWLSRETEARVRPPRQDALGDYLVLARLAFQHERESFVSTSLPHLVEAIAMGGEAMPNAVESVVAIYGEAYRKAAQEAYDLHMADRAARYVVALHRAGVLKL